ncbi:hypothetical protein BJ170DRAFT_71584 [Xylariales sp. AK1849]|nr:hypothetical protein BJ170DRAFT_71584 [Xylariales sp. AK1849]
MSSSNAPSHGQKVTLGQNAPVIKEGPGAVASDSLAAESEAFKSGNDVTPQTFTHEDVSSSTKPYAGTSEAKQAASQSGTGASAGTGSSHVATAPSYISSQYTQDKAGPHGKNIKEDDRIGTEDKSKNASFTEFGTKNDPGLLAEQKFAATKATPANTTGNRQKGIDGENTYEALGSDTQA